MNKILLLLIFSIAQLFSNLIHPPDNSELNYVHVTFQWEAVDGSSGYDLQLSLTNDFTSPLVNISTTELYYIEKDVIGWETNYFWRVRPEGGEWINTFNFTTTESSETFQNDNNPIEILEYNPVLSLDGITIFGSYYNNYSAAIDMNGHEVWNSGGVNTHVFFSVDENNNFLGGKFLSQYNNSLIGCEFSLNNSIYWSEPINEAILANESFTQHEFIKLPNGNYMGFVPVIEEHPVPTYTNFPERNTPFSWENECELYIKFHSNFDWKGEKIVEWDKNSGEIVWEWDAFNYYNLDDFDYLAGHWETACNNSASYDWLHFNALAFSGIDSSLYVSSRHLDRITKIDYNTKNIIWNIGIPWFGDEVIVPDTLFSGQHGLQLLPNGNIVTLDNGILSQFMDSNIEFPVSRAIELSISENNGQYNATTIWSHTLPYNLYGALSGNVQKLENGNYLINTIGNESGAYSVEVTENHEIAWMCKYNLKNYLTGPLYRAMRIPEIKIIVGCKDISACNYNADANTDDGSCKYLDCAEECGGTAVVDCEGLCGGSDIPDFICPDGLVVCSENNCELDIQHHLLPDKFDIISIYPNPFNPVVNINIETATPGFISGNIYNLKGQLIETLFSEYKSIGSHNLIWHAALYPSGIYLFILENNSELLMKKMILLK